MEEEDSLIMEILCNIYEKLSHLYDKACIVELSEPEPVSIPEIPSLDEIKQNIQETIQFKNMTDSLHAINNPDVLLKRIEDALVSFRQQTGRKITYTEMRDMLE